MILGASGMIGHRLAVSLCRFGHEIIAVSRSNISMLETKLPNLNFYKVITGFNIENYEKLEDIIVNEKPELIINAIGIVKQLEAQKEKIELIELNAMFPNILANICERLSVRLILLSTDCVYNGLTGNYCEDAVADANDVYGVTKYLGEVSGKRNVLTLRTSTVGREFKPHGGLLEWFLSQNSRVVQGFSEAIYSGFPTHTLAKVINDFILPNEKLFGIYHVSTEPINKYDLLHLFKEKFQLNINIEKNKEVKIYRSLNCDKFSKATGYMAKKWNDIIDDITIDNSFYESLRKDV